MIVKKNREKRTKKAKVKKSETSNGIRKTKILVIGVGGGGSSIVSEIAQQVKRADFVVANTDIQALKGTAKETRIFHFGQNLTRGLGCGMDARIGQKAAKDEKDRIAKLFKEIDLSIVVVSLGGGAGSGGAIEFVKTAKELGVITLGIFTLPFQFEGGKRAQIARSSLEKLIPNLNALVIIPNENVFQIIDKKTPLKQAFSAINRRLSENLQGLIEMIYLPGLINIDFADLKTILEGKGKLAYLNSASAQGPNRAEAVVKDVLKSPLNEYSIQGAEKIIFNITASKDLRMKELGEISETISNFNKRAKIIFGVAQDNNYNDKIRITLLAVGCGKPKPKAKLKPKPRTKDLVRGKPKPKPTLAPSVPSVPSVPSAPSALTPAPISAPISTALLKPKPRTKDLVRGKPKPKSKSKPKPKLKPKLKPIEKEKHEPEKVSLSLTQAKEEIANKTLIRRNALDLKKAADKIELDLLSQEKKWDIPAFLRREEGKQDHD